MKHFICSLWNVIKCKNLSKPVKSNKKISSLQPFLIRKPIILGRIYDFGFKMQSILGPFLDHAKVIGLIRQQISLLIRDWDSPKQYSFLYAFISSG